jgi:copper chaperone CopZ
MKTQFSISFLLIAAIATCAFAAVPATKPAAATQQFTHRVTGLFSRDREADLRAALKELPGIELISLDFDHSEAVFSYDPAKAFAGTKPDKIIERFDQQLRGASHHTLGIKPLCTTPRDKLERIEIPVAGLDCKACCLAAYEIMAKQDGVEQATASFKEGTITALIDPAKTEQGKLEAVLKERGVTLTKPK